MLTHLTIDNIAVIKHADLEFKRGFNVLTGETGAGKSILIDAINAVLGERTNKELIRNGCDHASVTAVFLCPKRLIPKISELGAEPDEEDRLFLNRTLSAEGRNICRINGSPVPMSTLKAVGALLIDIHGQHDTRNLFDSLNHLNYLDRFAGSEKELAAYHDAYVCLRAARRKLSEKCERINEAKRLAELYDFQKREIEAADLRVGEREELIAKRETARHAVKIAGAVETARNLLVNENGGVISELETAARQLSSVKSVTDLIGDTDTTLLGFSYEIAAVEENLRTIADGIGRSESELEQINDRLSLIDTLCRKYGGSVESVLEQYQTATAGLSTLADADEEIEKLESEIEEIEQTVIQTAKVLTDKRRSAANAFCDRIAETLRYLQMPSVRFEVQMDQSKYTGTGCDTVEFLISSNPGQPPKPLAKIASGGELSRIMLAIKSVFSDLDELDSIIFDEIDTGISGIAADKVGHKLRDIANDRQVICVTHLAQIASKATTHFRIEKSVLDGATETTVLPITGQERVLEIARIVSGDKITPSVLETAKELLQNG